MQDGRTLYWWQRLLTFCFGRIRVKINVYTIIYKIHRQNTCLQDTVNSISNKDTLRHILNTQISSEEEFNLKLHDITNCQ